MDKQSKLSALEKFRNMKFKIGYPDFYDNDTDKLGFVFHYIFKLLATACS